MDILEGMARTFQLRSHARAQKQGMSEILEEYPQFLNYEGEVVSLYPNFYFEIFSSVKDASSYL